MVFNRQYQMGSNNDAVHNRILEEISPKELGFSPVSSPFVCRMRLSRLVLAFSLPPPEVVFNTHHDPKDMNCGFESPKLKFLVKIKPLGELYPRR